ncbi:hemerythrin domain-containing protein [Corallococcus praedator]|uniref:Hemerythrin domain-containing protein n=1 Tax=Corallococcus praedator TaxID=2316724 RepID=A0ABX9QKV9_9BACT|nr:MULTISPECIES: hemerythrin domain-containing protein [Corallococcus]RKH16568.1 hemerythrin domain-containing protein [Corallococcus sp. CA047B]RKH31807.1 hemerythrin domain-containing protein [Corallococcus sp. CA031C]RKI10830.1 hemerythrin domain-containing protein [Corallococcus praedator]
MSVPSDFVSLGALHRELEELFLLHQEALMGMDLPVARERLSRYREDLTRHLEAEEALLLPELPRAGRIRGAAPELFTGEHQRMLELLVKCQDAVDALDPAAPDYRRAVLRVFDMESTFKHLEHHHSLREETYLFPALDAVLDATERQALLAAFLARAEPPVR